MIVTYISLNFLYYDMIYLLSSVLFCNFATYLTIIKELIDTDAKFEYRKDQTSFMKNGINPETTC